MDFLDYSRMSGVSKIEVGQDADVSAVAGQGVEEKTIKQYFICAF
ncbi:hypothetical protein [Marinobacter zhanjiangensis]|nr:hypothetical protein [Marinobacter zhanjiangensis]